MWHEKAIFVALYKGWQVLWICSYCHATVGAYPHRYTFVTKCFQCSACSEVLDHRNDSHFSVFFLSLKHKDFFQYQGITWRNWPNHGFLYLPMLWDSRNTIQELYVSYSADLVRAHVSDSSCMAFRGYLTNVFFYSDKILKHWKRLNCENSEIIFKFSCAWKVTLMPTEWKTCHGNFFLPNVFLRSQEGWFSFWLFNHWAGLRSDCQVPWFYFMCFDNKIPG